ncbi:hypothetical protein BHM03_00051205, partial [Ensete ventricosum]
SLALSLAIYEEWMRNTMSSSSARALKNASSAASSLSMVSRSFHSSYFPDQALLASVASITSDSEVRFALFDRFFIWTGMTIMVGSQHLLISFRCLPKHFFEILTLLLLFYQIYKVPATDVEALKSTLMGLFEKRRARKFFIYVQDYEENDPKSHEGMDLHKVTSREVIS